MDAIQKELLEQVAGLHEIPTGAYNIRSNGASAARNCTEHIEIVTKEDKNGIDIIIKPETKCFYFVSGRFYLRGDSRGTDIERRTIENSDGFSCKMYKRNNGILSSVIFIYSI